MNVVLRILYQLSTEDKYKLVVAESGCLPALMRVILCSSERCSEPECVALVINLACDRTAARMIGEPRGIRLMLKRAFSHHDPLLMKLLRNLSEFDELKPNFVDFLPNMATAIVTLDVTPTPGSGLVLAEHFLPQEQLSTANLELDYAVDSEGDDDEDDFEDNERSFAVECLGLLANLRLEDLDINLVLDDLKLLPWIRRGLEQVDRTPPNDDILLETIRLVGTASCDEEAAKMLTLQGGTVVLNLISFLNSRQEDDEIVYQILRVFYHLLLHQETRQYLITSTQVPNYVMDLMHDKTAAIRKICDVVLDIISEHDETWARMVQMQRFKWYNSQWLKVIDTTESREPGWYSPTSTQSSDGDGDYIDEDHCLMAANLLEDAASWFAPPPQPPPTSTATDLPHADPQLKLDLFNVPTYFTGEC
uniref:DUF1716 domain-containing protein n=1 Tax=Mesocestoides corti TaxID=53468 RepID=A0A5K3FV14_MESCO